MAERNSFRDGTLIRGFGIHIQRYEFAADYCRQRTVLDAGCGVGYGAAYLAYVAAREVVGVDLSAEALDEARVLYSLPNLRFVQGNVELLGQLSELDDEYDCIVSLENIEHIDDPRAFLKCASDLLSPSGVLVCSTPNGLLTERDESGRIVNPFHVHEYTMDEFQGLFADYFGTIELYGQWQTPSGRTRMSQARLVFEQLCEAYYNPMSRFGRTMKKVFGRTSAPAPVFSSAGESHPGEYIIRPLCFPLYPWPPEYLIGVCRRCV